MRSVWVVCAVLFVAQGSAQGPTSLSARVNAMRFCSQAGIRTIRLHVGYVVTNTENRTMVVPQLIRTRSATIAETSHPGHGHPIKLGYAPEVSEQWLMKSAEDGGGAVTVERSGQALVYGLYLPFFVAKSEAISAGANPTVYLSEGKSYRLTASLEIWTEAQRKKWMAQGYVAQKTAVVSADFSVPDSPTWVACEDEPPMLVPGLGAPQPERTGTAAGLLLHELIHGLSEKQ
jgi:hypothetical protein